MQLMSTGLPDSDAGQALLDHWHCLQAFLKEWGEKQETLLQPAVPSEFAQWCRGASSTAETLLTVSTCDDSKDIFDTGPSTPSPADPVEVELVLECDLADKVKLELDAEPNGIANIPALDKRQTTPMSEDPPYWFTKPMPTADVCRRATTNQRIQTNNDFIRQLGSSRGIGFEEKRGFARVFNRGCLENLTQAVIFANACVISADSDWSMAYPGQDNLTLKFLELGFACYYVFEIIIKISSDGRTFFCGPEYAWSIFDSFLALQAIYEQIVWLSGAEGFMNLSLLRLLRTLKVLKLLRLVRLLRGFRELRLILASTLGSAKALFWAFLLVLTITFMFAVCLLQMCASHVAESPADWRYFEDYWSSVGTGMLTLSMATMGGQDWEVLAKPLHRVGWYAYAALLAYVFVSAYGVFNILNSIFIQATVEYAERDKQLRLELELEKKHEHVEALRSLFHGFDRDNDGTISMSEFQGELANPVMVAFLGTLDIPTTDAKQLFNILSRHGKKQVDIDAFVHGCIKLKGGAKSIDLHALLQEQRKYSKEAGMALTKLDARLEVLLAHELTRPRQVSDEKGNNDIHLSRQMSALQSSIRDISRRIDQAVPLARIAM